MESLSKLAALCSEVTVILAAVAMLVKPLRNKLLGLDKLTDALKCQLRHDMLHTYYRHREGRTIRQYELEDFLYLYRGYKALGGNSFIDRIKARSTSGRWSREGRQGLHLGGNPHDKGHPALRRGAGQRLDRQPDLERHRGEARRGLLAP
ncbi:MAG: hypothetical protein ACLSHJ_06885 [Oscillospiraceae bacterium]